MEVQKIIPSHPLSILDLQYVNILADNESKPALLDFRATILVLNKQALSEKKTAIFSITLTNYFRNRKKANLIKFMLSFINYDLIHITGTICDSLNFDSIIPTALHESLLRREKLIIDAECLIKMQNATPSALNESETEISHFPPTSSKRG